MNVRIQVDRLCMAGVDERTARQILAHLRRELAERADVASWSSADIPVLRARVRTNSPREWARALADTLLEHKP